MAGGLFCNETRGEAREERAVAEEVLVVGEIRFDAPNHLPRQLVEQSGMLIVIDLIALDQVADEIVLGPGLARIVQRPGEIDASLGTQIFDDKAILNRAMVDRLKVGKVEVGEARWSRISLVTSLR